MKAKQTPMLAPFDLKFCTTSSSRVRSLPVIDILSASDSRKFQYMFLTPLSLEHLKDQKEDVEVVYFEKNQG